MYKAAYFPSFIFIGVLLGIIILNPYTVFGRPAIYISPFLIFLAMASNNFRVYFARHMHIYGGLLFISLIGVLSSILHGIEQYTHLWTTISWISMIPIGWGLYIICNRYGMHINDMVYAIFACLVINSLIIFLEMLQPAFRQFIESILIEAGNQVYDEGYKFRGVASSGGANLSLIVPVAVSMGLYLYVEKVIGIVALLSTTILLIFSSTLIGRTGLLMLPIPFVLFFLYNRKFILHASAGFRLFFMFLLFIILLPLVISISSDYLAAEFGEEFVNYSFGFLLEGSSGIKGEGTADIILDFLSVVPQDFPQVLIGYGFYGGSDFYPWTDSGYARMFMSVGYLFGVIYYVLILWWFFICRAFKFYPLCVGLLILLITESKEPFFLSGYTARICVLLSVFYYFDVVNTKFKNL